MTADAVMDQESSEMFAWTVEAIRMWLDNGISKRRIATVFFSAAVVMLKMEHRK